jgi:hypothetical protein
MTEFRWASVTPTAHRARILVRTDALERFRLQQDVIREFPSRVQGNSFEVARVSIDEMRPGIHLERGWAHLSALDLDAHLAGEIMRDLDPELESSLFLLRAIRFDPTAIIQSWVIELVMQAFTYLMRCEGDVALALDTGKTADSRHDVWRPRTELAAREEGMLGLGDNDVLELLRKRGFVDWDGQIPTDCDAVFAYPKDLGS